MARNTRNGFYRISMGFKLMTFQSVSRTHLRVRVGDFSDTGRHEGEEHEQCEDEDGQEQQQERRRRERRQHDRQHQQRHRQANQQKQRLQCEVTKHSLAMAL